MKPRFRCHPCTFRHFDSHRLPDPHLTHQVRLFPRRSPQRSSANAAVGGLEPPPAGRLRRAYLHLPRSTTSRSSTYRKPPSAFVTHHYACLPIWWCPITWPPSPMRTAFPSSLAGRDSGDYYEASVAIGLASVRRSRVRPCCTWQRDVGGPLISFNTLAGRRPALRRLRRPPTTPTQSA